MTELRLNQRVCRISWERGVPFLAYATVTKVAKTGCYVNGEKKRSLIWCGTAKEAFHDGYLDLFRDWDLMLGDHRRADDWTIEDTVRCVTRLRRLQRKLLKKRKLAKR